MPFSPRRLTVRTFGFHPKNTGAAPVVVTILIRTSSIEAMQRAFNAQSRERYPGGPPFNDQGSEFRVTSLLTNPIHSEQFSPRHSHFNHKAVSIGLLRFKRAWSLVRIQPAPTSTGR